MRARLAMRRVSTPAAAGPRSATADERHVDAWVAAAIPGPALRARAAFTRARLMDAERLRAAIPACAVRLAGITRVYEQTVEARGERAEALWRGDRLGLLLIEALARHELQALHLQRNILAQMPLAGTAAIDSLFDDVVRAYRTVAGNVAEVDAEVGGY